jgi:hypothetical protein
LKLSICFFELNKGEIVKKSEHGSSKFQIKIAYFQNNKGYAVYEKMPYEKNEASCTLVAKTTDNKNYLTIDTSAGRSEINKSTPPGSQCSQTSQKSKKEEDGKSKENSEKSVSETSRRRSALPTNLLKKKTLRVIEALLREYNSNTNKLNDLECMAAE